MSTHWTTNWSTKWSMKMDVWTSWEMVLNPARNFYTHAIWEKGFDKLINLSFFFLYLSASATQTFLLFWSSVCLQCWQRHSPETFVTFRHCCSLCLGHTKVVFPGAWAVSPAGCALPLLSTRFQVLLNPFIFVYLWCVGTSKTGLCKLSAVQDCFLIFQSNPNQFFCKKSNKNKSREKWNLKNPYQIQGWIFTDSTDMKLLLVSECTHQESVTDCGQALVHGPHYSESQGTPGRGHSCF